ncbi:MAG: (Na+)-NQR maturation NqrM [Saccharospirillum sp.]|nr:(Na+)-NQR maturation NqrM [Saccharospirillum sp.]
MATFLAVLVVMLVVVVAMAVGVIFGRQPIKGSCGGMAAIGMESECDVCGGDKNKCDKESAPSVRNASDNTDLGVDATRK